MQLAGSGGNTAPAAAAQNALGQPSLTGRNGTRIPTLSSPVFTRIIAEGKAKAHAAFIQYSELSDSIYLSRACTFLTDMPLARKVSLKRFLEKRKNRLTAADPYPAAAASESSTKQPSAVKDEGAPWLGVSSALSLS